MVRTQDIRVPALSSRKATSVYVQCRKICVTKGLAIESPYEKPSTSLRWMPLLSQIAIIKN